MPKRTPKPKRASQHGTSKGAGRSTRKSATEKLRARKTAARKSAPKPSAARPRVSKTREKPITRPTPAEEAAYTEMLIESGQAARVDSNGKLPAGATHKIEEDDEGNITVVRRRFSIT